MTDFDEAIWSAIARYYEARYGGFGLDVDKARDDLHGEIRALADSVRWQPIETAPKNERLLLLGRNRDGSRMVAFGAWNGCDWWDSEDGRLENDWTHWAPVTLPEDDE